MVKVELISKNKPIEKHDQKGFSDLTNKIVKELAIDKIDSTIEIILLSKEKIREINFKFRQIDKETDVLSFPLNSLPRAKEKVLGTIFISLEVANDWGEKLDDLIKHGTLHLLGFDHEKKPSEWKKNENKITQSIPAKAPGRIKNDLQKI